MKKGLTLLVFFLGAALAAVPRPVHAFQTTYARNYDIQRLQDDLSVMEDTLASVPTDHPRYREFRGRADDLRQDLTAMRDDMSRGRRDSVYTSVTMDDVNRVHDRIRTLQTDMDHALDRRWTGTGSMVLPEGTEMTVRLEQPVSSRTARLEDRVQATLARPVELENRTIVPAGTRVLGTVTEAERANKPLHGGRVNISFDRMLLDDGTSVDIPSRVAQVREDIASGDTAKHGAIGAALGGILGGVLGGSKGALVGVLLGGAGGAITATGDDVELPAGTVFTLQLDRPVTVRR